MAANEIDLKDILLDCREAEILLEDHQQKKDHLHKQMQDYYEKYNTHPPELLRQYSEEWERYDVLQQELKQLEDLSGVIIPDFQHCRAWLDKARDGSFQCDINLFDKPHAQRELAKENNIIAASPPSTTLRFVYADNQDDVVDNGYIFYWVYGTEDDNHIENDSLMQFTRNARPMLPIGVGRTDKKGFLRKSMMFKQDALHHIQDKDNHYLQLKLQWDAVNSAHLINHVKAKDWSTVMAESQRQWNVFGQLQGNRRFYLAHAKANRGHFDQALSDSERTLQDLYAFHLEKGDFEQAEALIRQKAEASGTTVKDFIKRVSNRYFYLFKPYGFMCYPIDRGSFLTKDLDSLAQPQENQPAAVWKGYLKPDKANTTDNQDKVSTIAIHCTLPEWDRRIQRQLRRLKKALDVYITNQKAHQKVTGHLDGMLQAASIYQRFSVDRVNNTEEFEQAGELIKNIQGIQETIENAQMEDKSSDNPVSMTAEIDDVDQQAEKLRAMLNSDALLEEFKRYWKEGAVVTQDSMPEAGPYMQEEPYWIHFFHSYCEAIILLRSTSLGGTIFKEEISPLLDRLIEDTDFSDLMLGKSAKNLIGNTDKFFAGQTEDNEKNINIIRLLDRIDNTNSNEEYEYNEKDTLLYVMLKGWKSISVTLFHRVPGPPSVLQVILDVYSDHISKKIQREALQKGSYHIKLMMVICKFLGVFGEKEFNKNRDLLYTALRAHGRLHSKGGEKSAGGNKNYYSHTALEARMKLLSGTFAKDNELNIQQKRDLTAVMKSVNKTKNFIKDNFYQRPFPGFSANIENGNSFSDTVYTASNHFAYKGIMALVNLGFMIESWINLPKEKTRKWDEGEHLRYIATLSDTLNISTMTAYKTSRLATDFRLTSLTDKMEQARKNSQLMWAKSNQDNLDFWNKKAKLLKSLSPFMDNFAVSLSLFAAVIAVMDGFEYKERGQNDKAMLEWFRAVSAGMVTYGFYAGKYAEKDAFAYLSNKVATRTSSILSRAGIALFLPYIGEAVALAGAILSLLMVIYDVAEMIIDYNRSTLLQQFNFHYENLSKLNKKNYFKLNNGQLEKQFKAIGDYDGFLWMGIHFNNLHLNALIPLLSIGRPLEQIREMLDKDDFRLITELMKFSKRVNVPELSGHYYKINDTIVFFPEIAQQLNRGTFFDIKLSPYQQRELILTQYARYNEYPRP